MSNALAVLDKKPAYLQNHTRKNIKDTTTVNSLGITGKVFSVSVEGEQKKLTSRNSEGDTVPMSVVRAIFLDVAPRRGRSFYEGTYDPTKTTPPDCWSVDGVKPHDNVPDKQHPKCDGCPQAVKGSGTNGKGMACGQHLMTVLLLVGPKGVMMTPLRLKLAITSVWDADNKEANEDGWYAWDQYAKELKKKGVDDTSTVVTKICFDPNVAYPKLMFSADRYVDDATYEAISPLLDSPEVRELLDATWTPAGVDGTRASEVEAYKAKGNPAPAEDDGEVEQPRTRRKPAPQIIEGEATEVTEQPRTRRKPVEANEGEAQPTSRRKPATEAPADEEDDEEARLLAQLEAARKKKAAAAKPAEDSGEAEAAPRARRKPAAAAAEETQEAAPRRKSAPAEEVPAARKPAAAAPKKVEALFDSWGDD